MKNQKQEGGGFFKHFERSYYDYAKQICSFTSTPRDWALFLERKTYFK